MLFNSLTFILFFLPVALAGFYGLALVGHRWAAAWLVAISILFYSWWAASLVFLLCGSVAFNFLCGFLILRAQGRERMQNALLTLGICGDLGLLIYYKYFFSLLNWLGGHNLLTLAQPYNVILPLGISFFTFTQIGYLVDCRGGIVKTNRFLDYCLFVTFFPHIIAGPILHHREMMPQFADPESYRFRWKNLAVGATLFVLGLAKKVVIADYFIDTVRDAFNNVPQLTVVRAWEGVLSYSLQLYFDFSGYSDMAIGLAILFGMRFPANFDSPYRAPSIIDFWQRWHMTLTRYLTLYLYSPIALWISRRRMAQGKSVSRQAISTLEGFASLIVFPTMITMAIAGIWHGAGLQFLIFGLLHGTYLVINHAWRSFGPRVPKAPPHPVLRITADWAKIALTYFAVLVSQVFFRANSVHDALGILQRMAGLPGSLAHSHPATPMPATAVTEPASVLVLPHYLPILALFLVVWIMPNNLQILAKYEPTLSKLRSTSLIKLEWEPRFAWGVAVGLAAALALLEIAGLTEFLYFRF